MLNIRVALRVPERLRKCQKNLKTSQNYMLVVSGPPKMKVLSILAKNS